MTMHLRLHSRPFAFAAAHTAALVALLAAGHAAAQEHRFAVVDLSPQPKNERVVAEVENEFARLRPGAKPIDDIAMRRLLATAEGPAAAATRLVAEADQRRASGDCGGAVERALEAEIITLSSVSLDDERDLLRSIYVVLVACEHQRGRMPQRDAAARRLRALVQTPPPGLLPELWDKFVVNATAPPATTELSIDSEPANAQVAIDFHGVGVTPRTLKVPPGVVYIEVQKEGYRKGFRRLEVGTQPIRTAFRLIERTHDRLDQALASVTTLRKSDPAQKPQVVARLAQYARADTLVVLVIEGTRAKIRFFDAERGAFGGEAIDSDVDPATGRVAALAARPTPGAKAKTPATTAPPGATAPPAAPAPGKPATPSPIVTAPDALPEAQAAEHARQIPKRQKPPTPWWSWVLAGAVGASLITYIYLDRPQERNTLAVRATFNPTGR